MKKILQVLFAAIIINSNISEAQITITSADMPAVGDIIRLSNGVAFTGMDPAATGANYNWDYSQLTAVSQTLDTFVSVLSTGLYALQFGLNSSFALKSNTPSVALGPVTIDYQYDFYKKATAGYLQTGFGLDILGVPFSVPFSPKDTIYRFPLHYNNINSSNSSFSVSVPSLGYFGGHKIRKDTVDGWGNLTTPYGTFSVLRVKSVINETDSIHNDSLGFGFAFPRPVVTEYKWLGTGQGLPLLQINSSLGLATQILYRDSLRNLSGISDAMEGGNYFSVFPNPATNYCLVNYSLTSESTLSIGISDILGKILFTTNVGKQLAGEHYFNLDLKNEKLKPGIYFVKLSVNSKNYFSKIVLQ